MLRDYIKATVGFEQLGAETGSSPKSLNGAVQLNNWQPTTERVAPAERSSLMAGAAPPRWPVAGRLGWIAFTTRGAAPAR